MKVFEIVYDRDGKRNKGATGIVMLRVHPVAWFGTLAMVGLTIGLCWR